MAAEPVLFSVAIVKMNIGGASPLYLISPVNISTITMLATAMDVLSLFTDTVCVLL